MTDPNAVTVRLITREAIRRTIVEALSSERDGDEAVDALVELFRVGIRRTFDEVGVGLAELIDSYPSGSLKRDGAHDALRTVSAIRTRMGVGQ